MNNDAPLVSGEKLWTWKKTWDGCKGLLGRQTKAPKRGIYVVIHEGLEIGPDAQKSDDELVRFRAVSTQQ